LCQEVVKLAKRGDVDLRRLPLMQCWPLDGNLAAVGWDLTDAEAGRVGDGEADHGRYVTFAGMHTIDAQDANERKPSSHNIGMYRAQLLDATHMVMHWHVHHDGAAHWRSWKRAGQPMPIAICFGGEPLLPYAATAPMPLGVSELLMAGFLNGKGIPLVRAKTVPLWVPANSEIVIEGWVSTECGPIGWLPGNGEPMGPGAVAEGPFGDHTGFYSLPDRYPIVAVTAVTYATDAIFPATIVGPPPQEDYYLGKATERIFLPLLAVLIPDIVDYHLPRFGCFHNCAFLQIRKAYPLQARRVMHAVWGAGQMAWTKMIVVVDEDVDVHDETAVLAAIAQRCDFGRDVESVHGPLDILDHAAAQLGAGGKFGFDATRKIAGEQIGGVPLSEPREPPGIDVVTRALDGFDCPVAVPAFGGGRCVFVGVDKKAGQEGGRGVAAIERVWQEVNPPAADLVIAVDARLQLDAWEPVFFHLCANTDPSRDIVRQASRLGIDATTKGQGDERNGMPVRSYPPFIEMTDEIRQRVTARWGEYGLG
jgi:4-hydroxy-3-polyprenylbenzoate decarboxylase